MFDLIRTHNLYNVIKTMIIPLFKLDSDKAIAMLLEKNKIRPEIVVDELETRKDYLFLVSKDKEYLTNIKEILF